MAKSEIEIVSPKPTKKVYLTKSSIKNAGSALGYREIEIILNDEIGPQWIKYLPMATSTVISIQKIQEEKGAGSFFAIEGMLEALHKCILTPSSTRDDQQLMYTREEIADEIPAECLTMLVDVFASGEKKVSETTPEQSLSSDSQDNVEPGTSGE